MQQFLSKVPHLQGFIKTAHTRLVLLLVIVVLISPNIYAQLPTFSLTANATNETCFGNGSISFSVTGTNPSATITYQVFRAPDFTTVVSTTNPAIGLQSGNYQIVATQTLGAQSNSQTVLTEILDETVPFEFDISSLAIDCGTSHNITVTILTGMAVSYEIFQGPQIYPVQSSPVFTNAPPGVYLIRVFNSCGVGSVKTYTVVSNSTQINVSDGAVSGQIPSCTTLIASNTFSSSTSELSYPLNLTYTIFPPDGSASFTQTQTINSGPVNNYTATQVLPSYNGQTFTYDLTVVDNCGGSFTNADNSIAAVLNANFSKTLAVCGTYFLKLNVNGFVAPYTVTFTSSPTGFSPNAFNASYPTFTTNSNNYGSVSNAVPFGSYTVSVVDGCGNAATATINVELTPAVPAATFLPFPGCDSFKSKVTIQIPDYKIQTAVIVSAPTGFPFPLPYDVSIYITPQGRVVIPELASGVYNIVLTDNCGNTYPPFEFTVPDLITTVSALSRTDCTIDGLSSLRLTGNGTSLVSVIMIAAPASFSAGTLPYDVSFNIASDGVFYMDSLPIGNYIFKVIDSCNFENTVARFVIRYTVQSSSFDIIPQCGSFKLRLDHISNAGAPRFWLQLLNENTGVWGNPITGATYVEGTLPNNTNSQEITANSTTLNLTQYGQFRIMKSFESFQSGTPDPLYCWEVLHEFYFDGEFRIIDIFKLSCDGTISDVEIVTNGVAPLIFKITHKNGVPFVIDNGNNNIFAALEVGFYNFTVEDACGVIKVGSFDVSELPSKVTATNPVNLVQCDDESNDGEAVFDLNSQIPEIIGDQILSELTINFYNTEQNAEDEVNPISNPSAFISAAQTVWVRVYNSLAGCYDIGSFDLIINPLPQMTLDTTAGICTDATTTLSADSGFDSYLWSTGETTREIIVTTPGTYSVTVTNIYADGECSATSDISVVPSTPPVILNLTATDWTDNENTITVELENAQSSDYVYSLDNVTFQESNVFTGLSAGEYTVFVKDIYECGSDQRDIYILSYPKFFTPNNDGTNDYWKVRLSELEPLMETYIYDRYGKFITKFSPSSPGWDGKFNGTPVFATDYWFVVKRQDGRELKGHFALKR